MRTERRKYLSLPEDRVKGTGKKTERQRQRDKFVQRQTYERKIDIYLKQYTEAGRR